MWVAFAQILPLAMRIRWSLSLIFLDFKYVTMWICPFFTRGSKVLSILNASKPGGDASPRRHLQVKARCLDLQIHEYQYFKYCQLGASSPKLAMPTRGRVAPRLACVRGATLRQIAVYFCHNNNFPTHFITESIISLIQFTTTLLTNAPRYPHHHTQTYAPISRTSRPQTMDAQR